MSAREANRRAQQSRRDKERNHSFTIDEWCAHRRISRGLLYKLWKQGQGPNWHYVAARRLISGEADAAWLAEREARPARPHKPRRRPAVCRPRRGDCGAGKAPPYRILIARPDIQAVGDTLFPALKSQTWRYASTHTERRITMADESKPELEVVHPTPEELDEEEKEFRALRCDLPGVTGAAAVGMLTVGVGRQPTPKNEFYRTHKDFRPIVHAGERRGRDGPALHRGGERA